jgi:hypothetical protein
MALVVNRLVNNDIRSDKRNQLKLHIEMTRAEIDEILDRGVEPGEDIDFEKDAEKRYAYTVFDYDLREQIQ